MKDQGGQTVGIGKTLMKMLNRHRTHFTKFLVSSEKIVEDITVTNTGQNSAL